MSDASTILNFAYGSNMLAARLRARVPSSRVVGTGCLVGHSLRWHKVSKDGSGKCDAQADDSPGACVWGVIYKIARAEKAKLDQAEGLGNGYDERTVRVESHSGSVEVHLYYATNIDRSEVPYDWYKALVVAGARENGLPAGYIAALDAVRSKPDPNADRERKNAALLART